MNYIELMSDIRGKVSGDDAQIESFAKAIIAATKEEDAKICEEDAFVFQWEGLEEAARRIRASK